MATAQYFAKLGEVAIGPAELDFGAYVLRDVVAAVDYLRRRSVRERVSGLWRDIVAAAS